ncbi:uncharacterized protein K02A2.6-like [Rhipicephalus sanguineus]|uniref:uncharacterized protein K02A2.6-like n=1 Tax=Rhipicephalus sanguineus TaxID=34632 RepID=UPI00189505AE|nr:uncharacterized protein K02A2.6-like [Rhipicephalus sanguineus]
MDQYPLPQVDDIFANLNGGEVFSTLDLNAYNQMSLVLNTHKGLYCFNRLAFGVSSAPAIFQRRMEAVLSGIPCVQQVRKWILQGWPQHLTETEQRFWLFLQIKDDLTVVNRLLKSAPPPCRSVQDSRCG